MDKYSKSILADAKKEYTKQLTNILVKPIYSGITSIYSDAKSSSIINNINILKSFQLLLSKTPRWEETKVENELKKIKDLANCDYLEDLLTAVFVTHTKVLISIKKQSNTSAIDLDVPNIGFFIHKVYIQCARNFWRQPWLIHTQYNSLDLQRNLIDSEKLIKESILETIRNLLPVKNVLKQYLGNNFIDEDYEKYTNEDITSVVSQQTKKNIRELLKFELEKTNKTDQKKDFSVVSISNNEDENEDENYSISTQNLEEVKKSLESNEELTGGEINRSDVIKKTTLENMSVYNNLSAENFDNRSMGEISILDSKSFVDNKTIAEDDTSFDEPEVNLDTQTVIEDDTSFDEPEVNLDTQTVIEDDTSFDDEANLNYKLGLDSGDESSVNEGDMNSEKSDEILDTQPIIETTSSGDDGNIENNKLGLQSVIGDNTNNTLLKLDKLLEEKKVVSNPVDDFSFFADAADF